MTAQSSNTIGDTNRVDQSARVYIATYPGMMNRFAQLDVGFFDLIIADESHRSIYKSTATCSTTSTLCSSASPPPR